MDAHQLGKQACREGVAIEANPFSFMDDGQNWSDWLAGFTAVKHGLCK
jgi:hypothetical protein